MVFTQRNYDGTWRHLHCVRGAGHWSRVVCGTATAQKRWSRRRDAASGPWASGRRANIPFQSDADALTIDAQEVLQGVAAVMTDFPTCRFLLEGYTDATSPEEYNLDLLNRRAQAVEAHLRALKVEAGRLSTVGYGETRLLLPEAPPTADNRRVEIAMGEPVEQGRP